MISHIDASLSRQPLVKGERLVRYEVNAVMPDSCGTVTDRSNKTSEALVSGYMHGWAAPQLHEQNQLDSWSLRSIIGAIAIYAIVAV